MVSIRKMNSKDQETLHDILKQTSVFTDIEVKIALNLMEIYLNNKEQQDYYIYVAESSKRQIAGYVCFGPTPATEGTYDIYWIVVSPTLQRNRIGEELLFFVEKEVSLAGGRLIIVETSSQNKYKPAQQFYMSHHYDLEARIKDFYCSSDDKLIFVKRLDSL